MYLLPRQLHQKRMTVLEGTYWGRLQSLILLFSRQQECARMWPIINMELIYLALFLAMLNLLSRVQLLYLLSTFPILYVSYGTPYSDNNKEANKKEIRETVHIFNVI